MKVYESEPFARIIIDHLKLSPWAVAFWVFLFSWGVALLLSFIDGTATIPGYSIRETLTTPPDSAVRIDKMNRKLLAHFSEFYETPHREDDLARMPLQQLQSLTKDLISAESKRLPVYVLRERLLKDQIVDFSRAAWNSLKEATERLRNMKETELRQHHRRAEMTKMMGAKTEEELIDYIMRKEIAQAQAEKFRWLPREDILSAYASYTKSTVRVMSRREVVAILLSRWDRDLSWIYFRDRLSILPNEELLKTMRDSLSGELKVLVFERPLSGLRSRLAIANMSSASEMTNDELAYAMYDATIIGLYYIHDWMGYILRILFFPFSMFLMVRYYQNIPEMFEGLSARGVFRGESGAHEVQEFLSDLEQRYQQRSFVFSTAVGSCALIYLNAMAIYQNPRFEFLDLGWRFTPFYHFIMGNGVVLLYAMMQMIRVALTTNFGILRMFRATRGPVRLLDGRSVRLRLELDPFHPDRCGGLEPIAKVSAIFNLFLFLLGITWALHAMYVILVRDLTLGDLGIHMIGLAIYALTVPLLFMSPLMAARGAMRDARRKLLGTFAKAIHDKELQFRKGVEEQGVVHHYLSQELEDLHGLYARVSATPVWPFELRTVSFIAGTVVLPVLLPVATDFLKSLLKF